MAVYTSLNPAAYLRSAEFAVDSEGNVAFLEVAKQHKPQMLALLKKLDQAVLAEAQLDDHAVLITRGSKTQNGLLQALAAAGEKLEVRPAAHQQNLWKWRGILANIAHPMQLFSGLLAKGRVDGATATFAVANILANITNMAFGAEKDEDVHQLRYLKEELNQRLSAYVPTQALPAPEEKRVNLRTEVEKPAPTLAQKTKDFLRHNSVRFGEIGLRVFGAFALVFPVAAWKPTLQKLGKKPLSEVMKHTALNPDKFTRYAGAAFLLEKAISLGAKVPDPYDPKPHGIIDTFREKVAFRLSSVVAGIASGLIAYDRLANPKRKITLDQFINRFKQPPQWLANMKGKEYRDWLGGIGGLIFVVGLVVRFFAPFGVKEVNMEELNAHMSDGLAKVPREKLPQLTADTAAFVKTHFKDKAPSFGEIYMKLNQDLYRYHGLVALPYTSRDAETAEAVPQQPAKSFTRDDLKKSTELLSATVGSHAEKILSPRGSEIGSR